MRASHARVARKVRTVTSPAKSRTASKPERHRQPDKTRRALSEAAYAPGTFYVHFPDKLAIFLDVYENWVSAEWSSIEAILKSGGSTRAIRMRLSRAVLEHHRKWRTFRASL